jgi:DNA mismatch repair ATPase MutS
LKNPLRDLEKLNERFDVLDALITSANCRHELHNNYLRKVAQISKLIRKMKSKATLDDCYNLCQCCKIDGIMQSLAEIENSEAVTNLIMARL